MMETKNPAITSEDISKLVVIEEDIQNAEVYVIWDVLSSNEILLVSLERPETKQIKVSIDDPSVYKLTPVEVVSLVREMEKWIKKRPPYVGG